MNKTYMVVATAVMCLFIMGRTALAQDPDALVVNVPFEFVVAARSLPPGRYRIERISFDAHSGLIIKGQDSSALVLPIAVDDGSVTQSAALDFERIGENYVLAKVETPDHAYDLAVPRSTSALVKVKDHADEVHGGTK